MRAEEQMRKTRFLSTKKVVTLGEVIQKLTKISNHMEKEKLQQVLHDLMEALGQYTGADRAYVFERKTGKTYFTNTIEWCADGVISEKEGLQRLDIGEIPYWYQRLSKEQRILIPDVEEVRDIMPHEYMILRAQGIHGVIAFPLFFGQKLQGFIGLDNLRMEQADECFTLLKLVGRYLGAAKENYMVQSELKDKTAQVESHERTIEEDRTLLEILCQDFTSVYCLNLNTGKFRPIKLSVVANFYQMKRVRLNEEFDFIPSMKAYANAYVVSDKEEFMQHFQMDEIRRSLKDKARVTFRYQTTPNAGGYQYFEAQLIRVREEKNQFIVLLAFHYIDDIIRQEMENQKRLQKALDEVQLSNEILSALGKIYVSIFRIDLELDHYDEVRSENEIHRVTGVQGKASDKLQELCRAFVTPKHYVSILEFFNLSNLQERLQEETTISREYMAKDGNWHQARFIVKKRNDQGKVTNVLFVIRVISETKRREEHLISLAEEANRANEAKTDFLSRMAHDIRTPMNAVRGFTAIAKTQLHDPEKMAESLHKIETASGYLQQIVNDILDLTSIERGKFHLDEREESLSALLESYKDGSLYALPDKKLQVECHIHDIIHDRVILDGLHLKQICTNLFSNAAKYTPEGGRVIQDIYEEEIPDSNMVRLVYRIEDTGIGMSKDYMKDMYNPFSRAVDTRVNNVRGSGLGLSVVKELVDLMGGTIEVHSQIGKGTTFLISFVIPYVKENHVTDEKKETLSLEKAKGLHLLVAEDNDLNYEVAEELLSMYGVTCERAENGSVCVEKFKNALPGTYDAILMDMQMPVMNGLDATRAIRLLERNTSHKVYIIGLTANAFSEDVTACLKAGMNHHMSKPFDVEKLLTLLLQNRGG